MKSRAVPNTGWSPIRRYWESVPISIKGLIVLIVATTVFAAFMPSPKDRARKQFLWEPGSTFEGLINAGAVQTYAAPVEEGTSQPRFTVVLVWDASTRRTGSWTFTEDQIQGCDVYEVPLNGENHSTALVTLHLFTTRDPKPSRFQYFGLFGGPSANIPSLKWAPGQREAAQAKANTLNRNFKELGIPLPAKPTAYVRIPGEEDVIKIQDGRDLHKIRQLFGLD